MSGNTLVSTVNQSHRLRDPIAGAVLHYSGQRVVVSAPLQKQQLLHSRTFHCAKDVDVMIQT